MKRYVKSSIDLDTMDMTPVFSHVEQLLGTQIDFGFKVEKDRTGRRFMSVYSNNLIDRCGIMSKVFSEAKIETFGSKESDDGTYYWMTLQISYELKQGGHNGAELCSCWYENGSWTFRDVE